MAFKDADTFGYTLGLPYKGKVYQVESPDYETGMGITRSAVLAGQVRSLAEQGQEIPAELMQELVVPDEEETDYYRKLLGKALDEMVADKCPTEFIKLAASTVTVWVLMDRQQAEEFWNSGGRPNRKRPADRKTRTTSRRTSTRTTRQG